MTTCSKNGIKKEGESCSLNNNCTYPDCLEKTFTRRDMLDFGMWAVREYIKTSTSAKPGEYIINTMQDRLEQFLKSKK